MYLCDAFLEDEGVVAFALSTSANAAAAAGHDLDEVEPFLRGWGGVGWVGGRVGG